MKIFEMEGVFYEFRKNQTYYKLNNNLKRIPVFKKNGLPELDIYGNQWYELRLIKNMEERGRKIST